MSRNKILIVLAALFLSLIIFRLLHTEETWSYDDYKQCLEAGYQNIEPDPPTCFHPDGPITPGKPKEQASL